MSPTLYQALGVYLPLITTNCAVLGVAILNITEGYDLLETLINGVGGALGFTLAIVLFAGGAGAAGNSQHSQGASRISHCPHQRGADVLGISWIPRLNQIGG